MDYRQQTAEANSWRRARQVLISNERNATPRISFQEEDRVVVGGVEFAQQQLTAVTGEFDPEAPIPLVDPTTGELTGQTASQSDLYVILHSLYMQLARARDVREANPTPLV